MNLDPNNESDDYQDEPEEQEDVWCFWEAADRAYEQERDNRD